MLINLTDPTPITRTEALVLLLNAQTFIENDEQLPIISIGPALLDIRSAIYIVRKEFIEDRIGRLA